MLKNQTLRQFPAYRHRGAGPGGVFPTGKEASIRTLRETKSDHVEWSRDAIRVLDAWYLFFQLTPRLLDGVCSWQHQGRLLASDNFDPIQSMNATSDKAPASGSANGPSPSSDQSAIIWFARIFAALFGGFVMFMFIGETLQNRHPGTILHVKPIDAALLIMAVLYSVGLFVALKWKRQGALLSLGAVVGFHLYCGLNIFLARGLGAALFSLHGVFNPLLLLFWLPVLLYVAYLIPAAKARKLEAIRKPDSGA